MLKKNNALQDELLEQMHKDIVAGKVVLSEVADQVYADMIYQYYPFIGSKINWSMVSGHFHEKISVERFRESIHGFFNKIVQLQQLSQENTVIVVSDSAIDVALVLSVDPLQTYLEDIISLPQHTFVVPKDVSWCACFTMEGDMDFGIHAVL